MRYCSFYKKQFSKLKIGPILPIHGISSQVLSVKTKSIYDYVPLAMRQYYELLGNHDVNTNFNRLYEPDKLMISNGFLVFAEENQNVVVWGIKTDKPLNEDPEVFQGQPLADEKYEWHSEEKTFSRFIIDYLQHQFLE